MSSYLRDTTLACYEKYLFEHFSYVVASNTVGGRLLVENVNGAKALDTLGFWRMSRNWFAIRDPRNGKWKAFHEIDLGGITINLSAKVLKRITFEEYVLLVLYDLWPDTTSWDFGWPEYHKLGEVIGNKLLETTFEEKDEDDSEDEDSDFLYDDAIDAAMDDPMQLRRAERYKELGRDCETIMEILAINVLPNIDTSMIQNSLVPWDRDNWKSGKWFNKKATQ